MTEARHTRRILQSIGAVLAGLLFVIIITTATDVLMHATGIYAPFGQPMADSLFLLAVAYRTIYGIAGGYITARLAPNKPIPHALILGVIGSVLGLVGTLATWNRGPEFGPKWYAITIIILAIPTAWIGGKLVRKIDRQKED
jgi:hypothetical protein